MRGEQQQRAENEKLAPRLSHSAPDTRNGVGMTTQQDSVAPVASPMYPATMAEALRCLDELAKERRAKFYPSSYAGHSGKRRAAKQDRFLEAQR